MIIVYDNGNDNGNDSSKSVHNKEKKIWLNVK